MLKGKKGVTLVLLVVAIILMLIIFGVTISAGTDLIKNSEKNRLMTNLYLIRSKAATLLEDYLFDKTDESLENLGEQVTSAQISEVGFIEERSSTEDVASTESFIIQYNITRDTVDVASTKGYENAGNTIYVLSELEEN